MSMQLRLPVKLKKSTIYLEESRKRFLVIYICTLLEKNIIKSKRYSRQTLTSQYIQKTCDYSLQYLLLKIKKCFFNFLIKIHGGSGFKGDKIVHYKKEIILNYTKKTKVPCAFKLLFPFAFRHRRNYPHYQTRLTWM